MRLHDRAPDTSAHSMVKEAFTTSLVQTNLQDYLFGIGDYAKEEHDIHGDDIVIIAMLKKIEYLLDTNKILKEAWVWLGKALDIQAKHRVLTRTPGNKLLTLFMEIIR